MDPHSRFSQFDNKRNPKAGPQSSKPRLMDPKDTPKAQLPRKPSASSTPNPSLFMGRPIATNSRVKQDEKTRKDMYLSFVNNALHQKSLGIPEPFDELVGQFNPKRSPNDHPFPQPAQLRLWILALSHVVSRLERHHATLVESIVNMPWTSMDTATVKSYTVFIGMLLSARPEYLSLVLSKITQGFTYQFTIQTLTSSENASTSTDNTAGPPLTRRIIYDRLHYLLQHLLSLIPTLPSTLMPMLVRNFPHKRQNTRSQSTYIKNLLRVCWYCPELSDGILELVIDRAIQIDVEIQVEIDDIETDINDETEQPSDIFDIDLDTVIGQENSDVESDSDGSDSSDDDDAFSDLSSEGGGNFDDDVRTKTDLPMDVKHIAGMAKKLDAILVLVFEHLQRSIGDKPPSIPLSSPGLISVDTSSPLPELPPLDLPTTISVSLGLPSATDFLTSQSRSPTPTPTSSTKDPPTSSEHPQFPSSVSPTLSAPASLLPENSSRSRIQTHFHILLAIFDRLILRTFKSRYTQFLLFWYTSLDVQFADIFMGMLVERALYSASPFHHDPTINSSTNSTSAPPAITRATAASYIGSFVSRAHIVDGAGTRRVMGVLCEWLEAHLDAVDQLLLLSSSSSLRIGSTNSSTLNTLGAQNSVFHAVSQAVFLIFCFRWRDLLVDIDESDSLSQHSSLTAENLTAFREPLPSTQPSPAAGPGPGQKWLPQLNVIKRVITSALNPLRACSPAVAGQFARVAHATGFAYCYSILESNKRGGDNDDGSGGKSRLISVDGRLNPELNTFFPFDPYALPRSNRFIEDKYRLWADVAIDDEEDDDDDDDEGEGGDEDNDKDKADGKNLKMAVSVEQDGLMKLGITSSFDAMSISPARPGVQAASEHHGK
ncbi:RNA polymerase I-specific transcription initiation factor RRN3 [Marasmius fiardii PR-910]|nr:RNA polymerase I-specific transcription initiation factor RRN3 [Marasmius fiardii PR-910]